MSSPEIEVDALLADPDEALRRWYAGYLAGEEDPDLILSGGHLPSPAKIQEFFAQWLHSHRNQLQRLLCEQVRYARLSDRTKQLSELALIALIAGTLSKAGTNDMVVDPLATAAVLVTRRHLDSLCGAVPPVATA
ncbi:hypothetical protein AB0C01_16185 [Micromonospora sp. NPDC048905]|uniref:hypothetical protein n=1 Tax=Micromonospora sp. NPDC048905 TaxID=3155494 RepID=UPI0033FA0425